MKERSFCMWCGKDHKISPKVCAENSRKASELVNKGVPVWVLMHVVENHGTKALDNFAVYANDILKNFKRR